jgi:rifampicin phosphotransferase
MKTSVATPQSRTPELVPLSQAAGRRDEVGVKAANLGAVMAAGFPVPDGVVLTAQALGDALTGLPDDAAVPSSLERWLTEALERVGPGPVVVRSSGIAEDLADASYAGQYETVLGVEGLGPVAAAVRRCWASGSAARVAAYERRRSAGPPRMAVLIQRLVSADAAGVAFTANPVSGARDEVLVSAVRGLGDRLVSGEVTPDEWVVREDRATLRAGAAGAIDGDKARLIARLAGQLETLFGAPQDVEWALAGDMLFVLQARPITALPAFAAPDEPVPVPVDVPDGYWEREASHFPLPLSPMTHSLVTAGQNGAIVRAFTELGLLADGLEFREIGGWMYTRVVPMGGKDRPAPPAPLMWLLLRVHPQLRARVATARRALREDLPGQIVGRWHDETRPDLQRRNEALRDVDVKALDDRALLGHWVSVRSLLDDGIRAHFGLAPSIALAQFELIRVCQDLLGWEEPRAFELLSGLSTMSTSPALALSALSKLAATRPKVRELVERADREAVSLLPRVDHEFEAAFHIYQREYATRARRYEVADPTLAETPELTLATLRDQLGLGYDGRAQAAALAARRSALLVEARNLLARRTEADRARFELALEHAEAAHPVREENEFFTLSVPLALARYTLLEFGQRLVSRGILADVADVFLLQPEEVGTAFVTGGDLRDLAKRRKGERAWVLAHPGPETYGQQPLPPPLNVLPTESRTGVETMLWTVDRVFAAARSGHRQSPDAASIAGIAASPGRYTGTVRVVAGEHEFEKIQAGDVLVCPVTSPVWSVLFSRIGALVTETGGVLSHPAIIAREYGLPAVVATGNATAVLSDGQHVTVDGDAGIVHLD